jgi:hypothetical protein
MLDADKRAENRAKTLAKGERKSRLIRDNEFLLSMLRRLVYKLSKESGKLNQWVSWSDIIEGSINLSRRVRNYRYAASRLLDLGSDADKGIPGICQSEIYYKLRNDWERRLFNATGLPLRDPDGLRKFQRLDHRFCIDSYFRSYSAAHPIIDRTRAFLCGAPFLASSYRPPPQPDPDHAPGRETQEGLDEQLAQPPSDEEVLERFAEKLQTGQLASNRMSLAEFSALRDYEVVNDYRLASPDPDAHDLQITPDLSAGVFHAPPDPQTSDTKLSRQRDLAMENALVSMTQAARSYLARKIR